ncbi:regulatory-associated protein of TOR 1-like [Tasmannia lanceolata]|uniref:regulatory-associated protein of TOR 1-like n=1 Tax=Tasmannia lanceolata TaxID=3420 RepID=UPI004064657E
MALGDLLVSRFSQFSVLLSNHLSEFSSRNDVDFGTQRRESESTSITSSSNAATTTSMASLPQKVVMCEVRHEAFETCMPSGPSESGLVSKWWPKDRTKTGCVALVLCLNIDVDPPAVIKLSPCARMECWIDPFSMEPSKALETIGKTLQVQYERWEPRVRYNIQLDPTVDDVKKLCNTCREYARSERVLFHYNGHGVPKPTANGEILFSNKSYTQCIRLPVSNLDSWLKTPSIYVFDCSAAGMIVSAFTERRESSSSGSSVSSMKDCILLGACEAHETLPHSVEFPADVFTSCLTTPIKMALRWFCSRSLLHHSLDPAVIDKIPGCQKERKTILGELNWIFTAVTDTIAWNVLPRDLFQRLFRQDLLVASLFRNFLLAERIMRAANCSPVSFPVLPSTHQHHMWDAWDMAAEICLSQLESLINEPNAKFQPSLFFTEQLTAFEVWLDHGSEHKKPPEQLPIVLQVLLSPTHRFRALVLLGRFLDMGPWALDLALSVGVFPYVLKLLKTPAKDLRQILVFIWTKILALDKSCQVDLVKDAGHIYFIKFLDSMDAYAEHRAMAAFVLAVILDGHRRGQEACVQAGLTHMCLRHLQLANPHDPISDPLLLQWLCLCLGKLWEDFPAAQMVGLKADAPSILTRLLSEPPQPEVRASAVFAIGSLLDVGSGSFRDGLGGDEDCDVDEKSKAEINIVKSLLKVVSDGSPLVRAEVSAALARFAFGHSKHLKLIAATYWKPQSNYLLTSLPSLANIRSPTRGYTNTAIGRDGRLSTSSPVSDNLSQPSDSGILLNKNPINGVINFSGPRALDNAMYTQCVYAMYTLAKDPSPRIAGLGRRMLSIIGIQHVATKKLWFDGGSIRQVDPAGASPATNLSGLTRSSSWLDMNPGHLPLTFRTPSVSPPQQNILTGIRRVSSLEFRPHQLNSPDSGLADPLFSSVASSELSEHSLLPHSTIYNWSCDHFSRPVLTVVDDNEEILSRREEKENFALDRITKCRHSYVSKLSNQIASWDTKFESGTKAVLLQPFSPIVIVADESERIRIWNYEEETLLNNFNNHDFPDKGISKLCPVNELDDGLLLVASCNGNVRLWKDYTLKGKQRLVTAFSSIQGQRPGVCSVNAVVDWQQQSGYLYSSGDVSSIMLWDLDKEQLVASFPSSSDCSVSALFASQVHGDQLAAGFVDGSVKLFDIRTPHIPVCTTRPHTKSLERVVGLGFQPGSDPTKIVSASQAGDIQFLDMRNRTSAYRTINAHRGSLTALAIHRHAPVIATGSANQIMKVFNLEAKLLSIIPSTFMAPKIGPVSCLTFHPYRILLAAGATDAFVSIYADESSQVI